MLSLKRYYYEDDVCQGWVSEFNFEHVINETNLSKYNPMPGQKKQEKKTIRKGGN